jgi:hypothetical protein
MERFFNTAGPVNPEEHYCLDPLSRIELGKILTLIQQKKYFVLHAPRQTGKTSCLLALMDQLNQSGQYRAVYLNVEIGQSARDEVERALRAIVGALADSANYYLRDPFPSERSAAIWAQHGADGAFKALLAAWAQHSPLPLVLLIDEIDALVGDSLIAVLRQLRAGYTQRPAAFPQSVVLCGVRDVRDYRIRSARTQEIITGGSAFNVKAESLRLGDFTPPEVAALYQQHTTETSQRFEPEVLPLVWDLTRGQPWLVNALAYEACFRMRTGRDRTQLITADVIHQAREALIERRETHLDQLVDKLQEERVRRVIGPMLLGESLERLASPDDVQYVVDLGLIRHEATGPAIANAIYREIIPRELTYITQLNLESTIQPAWYIRPDGQLDLPKLLTAFQQFFREHSEHWVERFDYKEAGPQLLIQAFLQRIVNGGGRVEREYGLGRRRTDLLIIWRYAGGVQRVVIELKIVQRSLAQTLAEGLSQTRDYMDISGAHEGHLVLFDRTPDKSWDEKIFQRTEQVGNVQITVWGM